MIYKNGLFKGGSYKQVLPHIPGLVQYEMGW